jgi:uncharacterized protein YcbK (DUF882 family)
MDVQSPGYSSSLSRRRFLQLGLAGTAALILPSAALGVESGYVFASRPSRPALPNRQLNLYNVHTGDRLEVEYFIDGRYEPEAIAALNHLLRDHRNGQTKSIDPRLFDLVATLNRKLTSRMPTEIISGYRSPSTNARLRRHSRGVAKNSYHVKGRALDIRIPGYRPSQVNRVARGLKAGGVGRYRKFVHIDTGPVRFW